MTPKTTPTPVFYSTSTSSLPNSARMSTSSPQLPSVYLDLLSRQHVALAQIVQEVPPSPGREDAEENWTEDNAKVASLRSQINEVVSELRGGCSDGNWGRVVQLLRLGATRGRYRWIAPIGHTPLDKQRPEGNWINAETEEEWYEWVRQREEEIKVKQKVEAWKVQMEQGTSGEVKTSATTIKSRMKEKVNTSKRPTGHDEKDPSPLGFALAKRSSIATKPKLNQTNAVAGPSRPSDHVPVINVSPAEDAPVVAKKAKTRKSIEDVPESSFLPPSFSSGLVTSTPKTKPHNRQKPAPIPRDEDRSSSILDLSVLSPQWRHNPEPSSSLSPLPPSSLQPPDPIKGAQKGNKRSHQSRESSNSPREPKKQKLIPDSDAEPPRPSSSSPVMRDISPVTPRTTRRDLTELLASTSSKKAKSVPKFIFKPLHPPPPPRQPTLDDIEDIDEVEIDLHVQDISPTKSLSSLAGSDSEDSDNDYIGDGLRHGRVVDTHQPPLAADFGFGDEEIGDTSFNPMFASTQAQEQEDREALEQGFSSSAAKYRYNSQFDIDDRVDKVSQFLERDMDYAALVREYEPDYSSE